MKFDWTKWSDPKVVSSFLLKIVAVAVILLGLSKAAEDKLDHKIVDAATEVTLALGAIYGAVRLLTGKDDGTDPPPTPSDPPAENPTPMTFDSIVGKEGRGLLPLVVLAVLFGQAGSALAAEPIWRPTTLTVTTACPPNCDCQQRCGPGCDCYGRTAPAAILPWRQRMELHDHAPSPAQQPIIVNPPAGPQSDPSVAATLARIEAQLARMEAQQKTPAPAQPQIIVLGPGSNQPYQVLPSPGPQRQDLGAPGQPRQDLGNPGPPKQDLPPPAPPRQDLPPPGQPRQDLGNPGRPVAPVPGVSEERTPPPPMNPVPAPTGYQRYSLYRPQGK